MNTFIMVEVASSKTYRLNFKLAPKKLILSRESR